jgi:hypothetical protein
MATRMLQRRGTASEWTAANTVLAAGEVGFETDTGRFKIGNGSTAWNSRPYAAPAPNAVADHAALTTSVHGIEDTSDLVVTADLASLAPLAGPTFSGTVTLPNTTSIGDVSATEIAYVNGVTSAIQTQLDAKLASATASTTYAPLSGPTFTGTVSLPNTTSIGDVSSTELGYVNGVTSAIQTQIDAKAPTANPTFTGTVSGVTKTHVGLENVDNTSDANKPVSSATQTALDLKANIASPTFTGTVTLAQAPTSDLHAATKLYVDNVAAGINFHEAVHAATTANLSATYSNGTNGVGATLTASGGQQNTPLSIDNHPLAVGERILIKDQTTQTQNGIYVVTNAGKSNPGGENWVITRATDADNNPSGEMKSGDFTFVTNGTTNASFGFVNNSTASPIVIGTDNITYTAFNAAKTVIAGTNLEEATPGTLSVVNAPTFSGLVTASATGVAFSDGTQTKIGVPSITTISQKTDSYTLSNLNERDVIIEISKGSATTLTIPTDATIDYPVGTTLDIIQTGSGQVTIAGAVGVTVNATPGLKLRTQWSSATLLKRASNTWLVFGDLTA